MAWSLSSLIFLSEADLAAAASLVDFSELAGQVLDLLLVLGLCGLERRELALRVAELEHGVAEHLAKLELGGRRLVLGPERSGRDDGEKCDECGDAGHG